jgi:hypothetical protein
MWKRNGRGRHCSGSDEILFKDRSLRSGGLQNVRIRDC